MQRRRVIATVGTGIGLAGCLQQDNVGDGDDGNATTEIEADEDRTSESDAGAGGNETGGSDEDTDESNAKEDDTDDGSTGDATFEVVAIETTSPVAGGETLEVFATVENVGDEAGTTDVDLVVGHDPTHEDSRAVTLEPTEAAEVTLGFRAGDPTDGREEFPVRVVAGTHEATETVVVTDDRGEAAEADADVEFDSCTRATVEGTFEDGDVAYASTGFYDEAGYGDTIIEDGITVGDDVEAPFTGRIVFEIGDEQGVSEAGDEIVVTVGDYGPYGTVITGLTTDPDDYMVGGITHENPHAADCLAEIESEWAADGDADRGDH